MIYGVGTDIVNIDRVKKILSKNRDGFVKRVLSEHEQALFENKASSCSLKTLLTKPSRFFKRIFLTLSISTRSVPTP